MTLKYIFRIFPNTLNMCRIATVDKSQNAHVLTRYFLCRMLITSPFQTTIGLVPRSRVLRTVLGNWCTDFTLFVIVVYFICGSSEYCASFQRNRVFSCHCELCFQRFAFWLPRWTCVSTISWTLPLYQLDVVGNKWKVIAYILAII